METIECRECRATIAPEDVLTEGRGALLTCPKCGMSKALFMIYDTKQVAAAKRDAAQIEKEFHDGLI
jgi:uncharacterized Zn finger protein